MDNPPRLWSDCRINWDYVPNKYFNNEDLYQTLICCIEEQWVEIMYDYNGRVWWRRNFNEYRELGL